MTAEMHVVRFNGGRAYGPFKDKETALWWGRWEADGMAVTVEPVTAA